MSSPRVEIASEVGAALTALAPPYVRVGARPIDPIDRAALVRPERDWLGSAADFRIDEFASGRTLLRSLLGRNIPIPIGADRAPVVPSDVVCSLAHDSAVAVGAVADRGAVSALGIDIEPIVTLGADVASVILRPDERHLDALVAFVVKEAVYKAWSVPGAPLIGHHDVRVRSFDAVSFEAMVLTDGSTFSVRVGRAAGRMMSLVVRSVAGT